MAARHGGRTGTALLVGLATGAFALTAGALMGGTTGLAFVALGLTLPGLLLQDSWRYSFFALGRGHHAFVNDTVWAAIQIPALVLLKMSGHANVFWFVLAWGVSAAVGAAIGALQARVVPNLAGATQWLDGTVISAPATWRRTRGAMPPIRCAATVSLDSGPRRRWLHPGRRRAHGPL